MVQKMLSPEAPGKTWAGHAAISEERTTSDSRTEFITSHRAWLTRRELEVLQLVTSGHSNAEIADRLAITSATIISYLNSIYGKLGVRSRTAAIRFAIDHHLCPAFSKKAATLEEKIPPCSAPGVPGQVELTCREMEVLLLVSAGLSNAEIADRLVITLATVIGYLNGIYRKLGVRSRIAAMRYAIDHSLC